MLNLGSSRSIYNHPNPNSYNTVKSTSTDGVSRMRVVSLSPPPKNTYFAIIKLPSFNTMLFSVSFNTYCPAGKC